MLSRRGLLAEPGSASRPAEPDWELHLGSLLTLNRAMLFQVDRHGRIVQAQGAVLDLLGIEPEQARGKWLRSWLPRHLRDTWSEVFRTQILARRLHQRSRWQFEQADGGSIPVEQTVALQIENGVVVGAGFWINAVPEVEDVISPLLAAPDDLTQQEDSQAGHLLHRLLDHLPLMVFILRGTEVVYINPAVARLTGYELNDLRTSFAVDLVDTTEWINIFEHVARCLETGQTQPFEQEFRNRAGVRRWADVSITRLADSDGSYLIAGLATDITARKAAEAALLESEVRSASLINSTAAEIHSVNRQLQLTAFNETFREHFLKVNGHIPSINLPILNGYEGTERSFWQQQYERALSGDSFVVDQPLERADFQGAQEIYFNPIRAGDGGVNGVAVYSINVTSRRQIERALALSEARQRVLIDNIHDALASLDKDLRLITMNATFRQRIKALYDVEPEIGQLLSIPLGDVVVAEAWINRINRVLKGERVQFEERLESNGIALDTDVTLTPIFADDASVEGIAITSRDVTERKRIEAAQHEYTRRLEVLQALDTELSQLRRLEAVLETAVNAAVRLTGASAGAIHLLEGDQLRLARAIGRFEAAMGLLIPLDRGIIGRVARQLEAEMVLNVHKDPDYVPNVPTTRAQITVPLLARESLIGVLNVQSDDPRRFNEQTFNFVRLFAGRVAAAIDNARLYEAQEKQVAELQALYAQVSDLEQLKTQMIRIAAHDLRNPLGTISGYVEMLDMELREQLSSRHQEFLEVMADSADRIDRISRNILALERANTAKNGLITEAVDIGAIALQVAVEYRNLAARHNKTFQIDLLPQPLLMQIDRVLIQEAISNLVGNAFKYTPEHGTVSLTLRSDPEQIVIAVSDNGYGIPHEQQAGLFQPFYRVKTEQTKGIKGSGLGLSLVKTIVERHGGHIEFSSILGEGSTFSIQLPGSLRVMADPAGIETEPADAPHRSSRATRKTNGKRKST